MGLDTIYKILIGLFLFSIFGSFVNDVFWYIGFTWKFLFDTVYFVYGFLGLSTLGHALIIVIYYFPLIIILAKIVFKFLPVSEAS